jgi:hypothetical protein
MSIWQWYGITGSGAKVLRHTTVQSPGRDLIFGLITTTQRGFTISGSLKALSKLHLRMVPGSVCWWMGMMMVATLF